MDENGDRPEVFRGHLEECFKHLVKCFISQVPKGSQTSLEAKKPLADFCGVTIDSVSRWMYSTKITIGEPYIKLMFYLDMLGYRVIELKRMPEVRRNFAELIGFGLLSSQQAAELIGYTTTPKIYEVLRGERGTSSDKEQKMWKVWKERKEELGKKKAESQERCRLDILLVQQPKAGVAKPTGRKTPTLRQAAVINIAEGLINILGDKSFDQLPENELNNLHETLLRLLNVLSSQLLRFEQRKGGG